MIDVGAAPKNGAHTHWVANVAPRRAPIMRPVDLPAGVREALRAIVSDLRDVPRDCIVDRAELFHWLRRMARRVEGVEQIKVPVRVGPGVARTQPRPRSAVPSIMAAAEAVFTQKPTPGHRQSGVRTIRSRKGRIIAVEERQLALWPVSSDPRAV